MRKVVFLLICFVFLVSGCGSPGGGAEFFETVMITANCEVASLDSDVIVWRLKDPFGNFNDPCDETVVIPDSVRINIKSEVFPVIEPEQRSGVRIEKVRIDYMPADDSTPGLASRYLTLGQTVEPGGNVALDIFVIHSDQKKEFLADPNDYDSLIINGSHYIYDVKLTFSLVEIITKKEGDVSTGLTIHLSDYICAEEGDINCDDLCLHD